MFYNYIYLVILRNTESIENKKEILRIHCSSLLKITLAVSRNILHKKKIGNFLLFYPVVTCLRQGYIISAIFFPVGLFRI